MSSNPDESVEQQPHSRHAESLPQALAATLAIKDEFKRADVLTALVDKLPPELLPQALEVAQSIEYPSERARALTALVDKLPDVLPQALEAAQTIQAVSYRVRALIALSDKLPEALSQALAAIQASRNENARSKALIALASSQLPQDLLPQVLEAAQAIQNKNSRAQALTALTDKLPEVLPQALGAAQAIQSESFRAQALTALVDKLPLELLTQALKAAQAIQDDYCRFQVLIVLADQLPEVLPQALEAAQAIKSLSQRAQALTALVDKLPEVLPQALETARVAAEYEKFDLFRNVVIGSDAGVGAGFDSSSRSVKMPALDLENAFKQSLTTVQRLLRYPSLDCPDNTTVNQCFTLTIELLIDMPELGATAISVEDPGTSELPEVEVVLRVHNFDVDGSNKKIMQVERDDDSVVTFDLTPKQLGEQQIRVDFYQYGRRIGTKRRNVLVSEKLLSQKVQQPEASLILELKSAISTPPPDLELCVELDRHDGRTLYYELHSVKQELDYHHTRVGQVTLQASPLEKMQAVYRELSKLAALNLDTQSSSDEQRTLVPLSSTTQINSERAERRLTTVGNQLWDELISDALKQQYWQFKGHVKSLLITSDEPWVPWEMIKPYRHVNGKEEQDPFWCQQFAISRWLSGPSTADDLSAKVVLPVAPSQSNLPSVQKEMTFLAQLTNLRSSLSPVTAFNSGLDLQDYIRENEFSILHFACHGIFDDTSPNDSAIVLADGPLRPSDLRLYFDQKQLRPLIFINACHGGRVGFSFTGLGGWAERLVKARVGAFVGAMWEVNDTLALQFARTFYKALLQDDQTIAEAFRQSREVIRQMAPYNSTWLAYSLYADPEARIQEETEVTKESPPGFRGTIDFGNL